MEATVKGKTSENNNLQRFHQECAWWPNESAGQAREEASASGTSSPCTCFTGFFHQQFKFKSNPTPILAQFLKCGSPLNFYPFIPKGERMLWWNAGGWWRWLNLGGQCKKLHFWVHGKGSQAGWTPLWPSLGRWTRHAGPLSGNTVTLSSPLAQMRGSGWCSASLANSSSGQFTLGWGLSGIYPYKIPTDFSL